MSKDARRVIQEKRAARRKKYVRNRIIVISALAVILLVLLVVLAKNVGKLNDQKATPTDAVWIDTPVDDPLAYSGDKGDLVGAGNSSGTGESDEAGNSNGKDDPNGEGDSNGAGNPENTDDPEEPVDTTLHEVTLVSIGDVLSHQPLLTMAKQSDGTYNFEKYFSIMKDTFQAADIAVANQETIFGGASKGYTTYPCFNTPETLGDALVDAGFDVITHSTNHVRDAGVDGIEYCINYWKTKHPETTILGIHESKEASDTITLYEKNGITFAMLNYTYGLNGFTIPSEKSYLVDLMTSDTKNDVIADIKKADELADFVIVFPHWGTENLVGSYTAEQKSWAEAFVEAGADLIIGTHPHVLEPVEWVESANGNRALCYYSLGNYISNQQDNPNNVGGMAKVVIQKQGNKTWIVEDKSGCVPLVNSNDKTGSKPLIQVYPIAKYTEELMSKHSIHRKNSSFNMDYIKKTAVDAIGEEFVIWE